ncbi:MAG: NfeD family protein [Planctomycetota bacterium]
MNLLFAAGLLGLGFLMIVAEVMIPSMGALAVLSVLSLSGSVLFAFRESTDWGVGFIFIALFGGVASALLAFKIFPKTPMGRKLIVRGPTFANDIAATDPKARGLDGKSGVAITYMRPAGIVEIEGRRIDCVAEGELLAAGTPVKVIRVEGNVIYVKPV